ncbi:DEAD/DEAH box helicase [Vibrio parahaemolyticus]|uniref:DEAD/DEAH box helicase n=1 Tax=Vibrio parahaemolyticus TaxID=670 RepID=UPI00186A4915|nr:DEAD/DEAH box helicase [Vibrio parahaemolyticus]MBE3843392.1 DEAD/DEAH box helicase [Vibrio parahaemolyticus]MBE3942774.1 DEAD/DEAH box helicase [Vibrio parahaemolyticus]MBE4119221.1 DEAD/DEAH box helicase [Vibrio parahaemolyticus]MBE4778634.1 DEAD/DEAH box helicase [Vibrio parahaemolyticus]MEA5288426.1 DEAD/DEAH box helicase [Vibrio parahaemolyticus]
MKNELPLNHGLPSPIADNLVHREGESYSLSDVQYEALEAGVGRGDSLLVVSPTSTGKTKIAVWALANGILTGCNTVYLVTHRALAAQKFSDFADELLPTVLCDDKSSLVLATGDTVEDANGELPTDPLKVRLLVATYEKYLALLSATGIPKSMNNTVVACDEIQLIDDEHRGQNVEVLLTLLKAAGWKQFIGLSAVLLPQDADMLANWLNVRLVTQLTREKHLKYECWSSQGVATCSTDHPSVITEGQPLPTGIKPSVNGVITYLLSQKNPPTPIIVFCMKKAETYDLARQFIGEYVDPSNKQLSLAFEELPETSANQFLSQIIEHRIGSHSADLTDEERLIIESKLKSKSLDVVFATSTLGAGVNFPFGAAVFASWRRWNGDMRQYIPISSAEFHNMSGRVGRMGFGHEHGRVIFFAPTPADQRSAGEYLQLDSLPPIQSRISANGFEQLVLQLVSSGLCQSSSSVSTLICGTLSGLREQDRNLPSFNHWPQSIRGAIDLLCAKELIVRTNEDQLYATTTGKAIAYTGLRPNSGIELIKYCVDKADVLMSYLDSHQSGLDKFAYLIFYACFSCSEFRAKDGHAPSRFLPYPLDNWYHTPSELLEHLIEPMWQTNRLATNASKLSLEWINGVEIVTLERSFQNLTAGMLRESFRNLIWVMQGLSTILLSVVDNRIPISERPSLLNLDDAKIAKLKRLPRVIRRLSYRLNEGLPDDVLWITSLSKIESPQNFRLQRPEILSLRADGAITPELLALGTPEMDTIRLRSFHKVKPSPHAKANWLRDASRVWKTNQRRVTAERHIRKAQSIGIGDQFQFYYSSLGNHFEAAFEGILALLGIEFQKLDDKTQTGAPDYLLLLADSPALVVELKSKKNDKLVDYNGATEVLAASEIHGYGQSFCCTLCHPGVDPSVAPVIINCARLSIVESHDLGEALLRVAIGELSQGQLWQWLATPGQAIMDDIPYKGAG